MSGKHRNMTPEENQARLLCVQYEPNKKKLEDLRNAIIEGTPKRGNIHSSDVQSIVESKTLRLERLDSSRLAQDINAVDEGLRYLLKQSVCEGEYKRLKRCIFLNCENARDYNHTILAHTVGLQGIEYRRFYRLRKGFLRAINNYLDGQMQNI